MSKLKLFIADASGGFCENLAQTLSDTYQIETATHGAAALEAIMHLKPDILVLDLMLPELDGISLLQQCALQGIFPTVLATTGFVSDYVLQAVKDMQIGYLMLKPCDIGAVTARIHDLAQRFFRPSFPHVDPRSHISHVLLNMGFSPKLRGYSYLREAILLMAENPWQSVTKELYPAVAGRCGATVIQIERSIRSAIICAWAQGDGRIWQLYFPKTEIGFSQRPTNAAIISRLAELISIHCSGINFCVP